MKKLFLILLCGLLCSANLNALTWNIGRPATGSTPTNAVIATLNGNTLTISGTGAVVNWAPWYSIRSYIHIVVINNGVTNIGEMMFYDHPNLTTVTIGNSVTTIGGQAFQDNTALTTVTIGTGVTTIGEGAFWNTPNLRTLNFNAINIESAWGLFEHYPTASITAVNIGNAVQRIPSGIFTGFSNLTSIVIPNSVITIGSSAFVNTGLTSIDIPNSVTEIGDGAFTNNIALTSVIIGNGVTTIGNSAFAGNTALTYVSIGNRVTTIGNLAFANSPNLRAITINRQTPPAVNANAFQGLDKEFSCLYVPPGAENRYQNANVWGVFWCIRTIDPTNIAVGEQTSPLQIHPNPFTDEIHIVNAEIGSTLYVLNAGGLVVHSQRITATTETIRLSHLPNGVYILRIGNRTVQIVKQ